jgi:Helix-turn-helix domain
MTNSPPASSDSSCSDEQPYRDGVTLIGDAAATSAPAFGCGLSLTLRDVRVPCDHLLVQSDWDAAAITCAAEHDRYYTALHRIEGWWHAPGMAPHRYLRVRQLNLARRTLALVDPATETVTEIATQHGFWELGRFAVTYRVLFGERPSTTLRRAPGDHKELAESVGFLATAS